MCFREEADEYIDIGALNGIFVLGRSMGFIGKLVVRVLFGFGFLFVCFTPWFRYTPCLCGQFLFLFLAVLHSLQDLSSSSWVKSGS